MTGLHQHAWIIFLLLTGFGLSSMAWDFQSVIENFRPFIDFCSTQSAFLPFRSARMLLDFKRFLKCGNPAGSGLCGPRRTCTPRRESEALSWWETALARTEVVVELRFLVVDPALVSPSGKSCCNILGIPMNSRGMLDAEPNNFHISYQMREIAPAYDKK